MTALENKILEALKAHAEWMDVYDADRKADYDSKMKEAEMIESEYFKKDKIRSAEWDLSFQKHGYDFCTDWQNVIARVMYGRVYYEWHSAEAGRYKGTGHGAYITSELTDTEQDNVYKVFEGLVKHGYMRLSKSGKKAKFVNR